MADDYKMVNVADYNMSTTAGSRGALNAALKKLKGSWLTGSKVREPTAEEQGELTSLSNTVRANVRYEGGGITAREGQMADNFKALKAEQEKRKKNRERAVPEEIKDVPRIKRQLGQ